MKSPTESPVALPARMSLVPGALADLEIAVLDFPYKSVIDDFLKRLKQILRKDRLEPWQYPPSRLLNNAIVACAPTVVHGFEEYGNWPYTVRRMLAVGQPQRNADDCLTGSTLCYPTEEQIAHLIRLWVQLWGQHLWLKKRIEGEAKGAWEEFTHALQQTPRTRWHKIDPEELIADLSAENGLAFRAIPSLLATLLHGEVSIIGSQGREVHWRRAQAGSDHRLCIVSEPLDIAFRKESRFISSEREGYFAYKLEFQVQTQTGRREPWIYVFLRCQRYAHKRLSGNERGNEISILMGNNKSRKNDWPKDSTLVRLKANAFTSKQCADWEEDLPNLLADFKADSLTPPQEIYSAPLRFWNLDRSTPTTKDEYYVIHTEGYRYGRSGHDVMTGFGLAERSEVIDQTCGYLLNNILKPDTFLVPDTPVFDPKQMPRALWTYGDLAAHPPLKSSKKLSKELRQALQKQENDAKRKDSQYIPAQLVARALCGGKLILVILYRNPDTLDVLKEQLREAFLLNDGDQMPPNVVVIDIPILDDTLCQPLDTGDLSPEERHRNPWRQSEGFREKWDAQIQKAWWQRRDQWRSQLREAFRAFAVETEGTCRAAFIELPKESEASATFHQSQSVKGVIREACVREGILSQMLSEIKLLTNKTTGERFLPGSEKGRAQNVVQEIVSRQMGALYDSPAEFYRLAGIPETAAQQLDVIAFCLITKQSGVRYGLAVRLRASGEMDVLSPEMLARGETWVEYAKAGPLVGKIFAEARKDVTNGKIRDEYKGAGDQVVRPASAVRLSPTQLTQFVEVVLTTQLERSTIALVDAENWRQAKTGGWTQLRNTDLEKAMNRLAFGSARDRNERIYVRQENEGDMLKNLLAVIRIRTGEETPQYITNRKSWQRDTGDLTRDLFHLSGFVDQTTRTVFHYFSIGRLPQTTDRTQSIRGREDPYKIDMGGGIAFKHQQMVEMVPFFVREDFQTEAGKTALCRVAHYLRSSPAWAMGNLLSPYPMHLGDKLIADQLCILGIED